MDKIIPGIFYLLAILLLGAPCQSHAAIQSGNLVTQGKNWAQMTLVEKTQMVCALSVLPVAFVAEIMFIVAGFKTSVGWGLFMLFIGGMRSIFAALAMLGWMIQWMLLTHQREPLKVPGLILGGFIAFAGTGALIFIFRHWEHARKPLAAMGLGAVLILTVLALQFAK
jgi:hypothetical protein